ncbi:cytochrome b subunit of succinate dehydrogenase, Sdh3p [Entomortierella chlamydospora]|uniref:Cytochrome b subunit of succinate dehydrogenase, Sdh3p n=1 Tax=Entomortierella chlamydospora TaxID=101097 RepID=A0A9P6MPV5_9FUNG|nr:cytochrome b subunit of succinate dehydrogenase, Sdh3p [Entomortierella chlamydospora]
MLAHRVARTPLSAAGTSMQFLAKSKTAVYKAHVMAPVGTRILSTSQSDPKKVVVAPIIQQRKDRPLVPTFSIYEPELTWCLSGLHRVTGAAVAVGFYGGAIAYTLGPLFGLGFDSADVTSMIATIPDAAKIAGKFVIAFPFTFHSLNGIRHLIWDTASALTLKGVYTTGYTVMGLSIASAAILAFM